LHTFENRLRSGSDALHSLRALNHRARDSAALIGI
jgi:hypothetical protein